MKKLTIVTLCVTGIIGLLVSGCGTAAKGPTDEELLAQVTQDCTAAAKAKDIPKLMTFYSEKFSHYELGDKAGLADFLGGLKDQGMLDNLEVDLANAKTTIENVQATVGPVVLKGGFGEVTITFSSAKVNGTWKIVGMDVSL